MVWLAAPVVDTAVTVFGRGLVDRELLQESPTIRLLREETEVMLLKSTSFIVISR
jgi:hypothetical protein